MLATNHTLTGIVLAVAVKQPLAVVPLAFASHLALDTIPHFGDSRLTQPEFFFKVVAVDLSLAAVAFAVSIAVWPGLWLPIALGVAFALMPDILFFSRIWIKPPIFARFGSFHGRIQLSETPSGIYTEYVWAGLMVALLMSGR